MFINACVVDNTNRTNFILLILSSLTALLLFLLLLQILLFIFIIIIIDIIRIKLISRGAEGIVDNINWGRSLERGSYLVFTWQDLF